jgi:8-oxo-dGTP pyrophosphatase MutT (NUDIX family)
MSYLERIRTANRADLGASRRFVVAGEPVGWITDAFAAVLARWPDVFLVEDRRLTLRPDVEAGGPPARSRAVAAVLRRLRDEGVVTGWRDEQYPVGLGWGRAPLMTMERAAVPCFGVGGYGVHMNGFCRPDRGLHLWVAKRSATKATDPGKLDQLVAGGQPAGMGLIDNLVKECEEEAGIPAELAVRARPAGVVTYALSTTQGFRPDVLFVFDLELPPDFRPRNADGEVEAFYLWPVERVAEVVRSSDAFKFNCALVVIDFLIRHGVISPEEPDYAAIVAGLRGREAFLRAPAHSG